MRMNMTPAERLEAVADNLIGWKGDVCFLAEVIIQETGNRRYFWTPSGKLLGHYGGDEKRRHRRKKTDESHNGPKQFRSAAEIEAFVAAADPQICDA